MEYTRKLLKIIENEKSEMQPQTTVSARLGRVPSLQQAPPPSTHPPPTAFVIVHLHASTYTLPSRRHSVSSWRPSVGLGEVRSAAPTSCHRSSPRRSSGGRRGVGSVASRSRSSAGWRSGAEVEATSSGRARTGRTTTGEGDWSKEATGGWRGLKRLVSQPIVMADTCIATYCDGRCTPPVIDNSTLHTTSNRQLLHYATVN